MVADLDPLELKKNYLDRPSIWKNYNLQPDGLDDMLNYKKYGFTEADLERDFYVHSSAGGTIRDKKRIWKLKDLIQAYETAYCGKIGVEFTHIPEKKT